MIFMFGCEAKKRGDMFALIAFDKGIGCLLGVFLLKMCGNNGQRERLYLKIVILLAG